MLNVLSRHSASINMINIVMFSLFLSHLPSAPVPNGHLWVGEAAALFQREHKTRPPPPCHLQSIIRLWGVGYQHIRLLMTWRCHWLREKHVEKGRDGIAGALLQNIWSVHIWRRTKTGDLWVAQLSGGRCNSALCWSLCHLSHWSPWLVQRPAGGCLTVRTPRHISFPDRMHLPWRCFLIIRTGRLLRLAPMGLFPFIRHTGALWSPLLQSSLWLGLFPCLKC